MANEQFIQSGLPDFARRPLEFFSPRLISALGNRQPLIPLTGGEQSVIQQGRGFTANPLDNPLVDPLFNALDRRFDISSDVARRNLSDTFRQAGAGTLQSGAFADANRLFEEGNVREKADQRALAAAQLIPQFRANIGQQAGLEALPRIQQEKPIDFLQALLGARGDVTGFRNSTGENIAEFLGPLLTALILRNGGGGGGGGGFLDGIGDLFGLGDLFSGTPGLGGIGDLFGGFDDLLSNIDAGLESRGVTPPGGDGGGGSGLGGILGGAGSALGGLGLGALSSASSFEDLLANIDAALAAQGITVPDVPPGFNGGGGFDASSFGFGDARDVDPSTINDFVPGQGGASGGEFSLLGNTPGAFDLGGLGSLLSAGLGLGAGQLARLTDGGPTAQAGLGVGAGALSAALLGGNPLTAVVAPFLAPLLSALTGHQAGTSVKDFKEDRRLSNEAVQNIERARASGQPISVRDAGVSGLVSATPGGSDVGDRATREILRRQQLGEPLRRATVGGQQGYILENWQGKDGQPENIALHFSKIVDKKFKFKRPAGAPFAVSEIFMPDWLFGRKVRQFEQERKDESPRELERERRADRRADD